MGPGAMAVSSPQEEAGLPRSGQAVQRPRQSWRRAHTSRPRTPAAGGRPSSCPALRPSAAACGHRWTRPWPSTLGPEWPAAGWAQGPDLTARGSLTLRGAARPQMASPVHAPPASAATSPAINSRLPVKSALPAQEAFNSQPPPQSARCPWGGKPRGPAPGQCGGSERSFKPPSVTSGFNFLYEICTFPPRAFITWYII